MRHAKISVRHAKQRIRYAKISSENWKNNPSLLSGTKWLHIHVTKRLKQQIFSMLIEYWRTWMQQSTAWFVPKLIHLPQRYNVNFPQILRLDWIPDEC